MKLYLSEFIYIYFFQLQTIELGFTLNKIIRPSLYFLPFSSLILYVNNIKQSCPLIAAQIYQALHCVDHPSPVVFVSLCDYFIMRHIMRVQIMGCAA